MRYFYSLFILITACCFEINAQYQFSEATDISIISNGEILDGGLSGGLNTPQFNKIDLNLDGTLDLIVYDRFRGQVRPYINEGIPDSVSYSYAPEYANRFPQLGDYLIAKDYNDDGKIDLFTLDRELVLYENTSTTTGGLSFQATPRLLTVNNPPNPRQIAMNPTSTDLPGIYDVDNDKDLDILLYDSRRIAYQRNLSLEQNNDFVATFENRNKCWGFFSVIPIPDQDIIDSIKLDSCNRATRGERRKGLKHVESTAITPIDIDRNSSTDILISFDGTYRLRLLLNDDSLNTPGKVDSRMYRIIDTFPDYGTPVHLLSPAAYIIDVDNDNRKDLIVASNHQNLTSIGPYAKEEFWFYKNIASDGSFRFQLKSKSFLLEDLLDFGRTSKPIFFDYNKDGLMDILVGNGGYLTDDESSFIDQLALLKNVGTKQKASFELIDRNYLNLPSLGFKHDTAGLASAAPCVGDLDGDNDDDLLLTQRDGTIYWFEDTSNVGEEAQFKFHPESFQSIQYRGYLPLASQLFDYNEDGLLDLILNRSSNIDCYINFGTKSHPIFNIAIDSLYAIGGDSVRYHFRDTINFSLLNIGDTMLVNNALVDNNNPTINLILSKIDSSNNYIECINTIDQGVPGNSYDEFNTTAHINLKSKTWRVRDIENNLSFGAEKVFLFRDNNQINLMVGSPDGNNYYIDNFSDTISQLYQLVSNSRDFMTNYGANTFIDGTDLNGDSIIDLVVGLNTGGIKILYGSESTGISDAISSSTEKEPFFDVFPNPTNNIFTIELNQIEQGNSSRYELRDVTGKLVLEGNFQGTRHQVSVGNLPKGIYLINLTHHRSIATRKLVID